MEDRPWDFTDWREIFSLNYKKPVDEIIDRGNPFTLGLLIKEVYGEEQVPVLLMEQFEKYLTGLKGVGKIEVVGNEEGTLVYKQSMISYPIRPLEID